MARRLMRLAGYQLVLRRRLLGCLPALFTPEPAGCMAYWHYEVTRTEYATIALRRCRYATPPNVYLRRRRQRRSRRWFTPRHLILVCRFSHDLLVAPRLVLQ